MTEPTMLVERIPEFRDYLRLLARMQLPVRMQGKMDASDLVQQTLLEAHRDADQFRGTTSDELAVWLRRILARNLANALRQFRQKKRDMAREVSLEAQLQDSSLVLQEWLAQSVSLPDDAVAREEQLLRLSSALAGLPELQREAVELRHLHGWSLQRIAEHLERTPAAVAGLLHRGLRTLRDLLTDEE